MANKQDEERKKAGVPLPFGGGAQASTALATGGVGAGAAARAVLLGTAGGKAAILGAVVAAWFGALAVGKAMQAADAPTQPAAVYAPQAPAKEIPVASAMPSAVNSMQVSPMPISALPPAAPVAGQDESVVGAAAVGGPESASSLLAQAKAMPGAPDVAPAGAAAGGLQPNHILAKRSAIKGRGLSGVAGAGVATDGGIGSSAPPANAAFKGVGIKPGASRGFGSSKPTGAVVASAAARSVRAGTAKGQLHRAAMAMGGGGNRPNGEAGMSLGAQVFDGGGAQNTSIAQNNIGISQAAQEAADAKPSDYGDDGAPVGQADQHPGGGFAAAAAPQVEHKNATPWQPWVDSSTYSMYSAMALLMTAMILGFIALHPPGVHSHGLLTAAKACAVAAGVIGLGIISLGAKIKTMGQQGQGNMFVISGTLITVFAAIAYVVANNYQAALQSNVGAQGGAVSDAMGPVPNKPWIVSPFGP